jgi:hypothetical protein
MNATVHTHASRWTVEMSCIADEQNTSVTELLQATLMQRVKISIANGCACGTWRHFGNV